MGVRVSQRCLVVEKQVPVGEGNQIVARNLPVNINFLNKIVLNKSKILSRYAMGIISFEKMYLSLPLQKVYGHTNETVG